MIILNFGQTWEFIAFIGLAITIPAGAREKVATDLGLGGAFRRVLRDPPQVTTC